jgi:DNA-binding response OmpR family regulator
MPTISGIDLAIQVQKEFPGCKVLLFSGRADSREMLRAAGASGQAYHILAKPVYPSELLKRIRSMLDVEHPFGANYH